MQTSKAVMETVFTMMVLLLLELTAELLPKDPNSL